LKILRYIVFLLISFVAVKAVAADVIPSKPNPPRLVNDFSSEGFLTSTEIQTLENKLQTFAKETSNQIVVVVVDDLGGMEAWDYATQLGKKWGVGQDKFDNGVVILIKPTGGQGQRDLFIAVGSGLEGAIPDITTKQIRENEMYPYLKQGQNYEAIDRATNVLMALAKGEYNSDAYGKQKKDKISPYFILLIIIIVIFVISRKGGGGRGMTMGSRGVFFGPRFGGGFGGGSFGGGSSGGFGGFGGGGFSGGGSGGKW